MAKKRKGPPWGTQSKYDPRDPGNSKNSGFSKKHGSSSMGGLVEALRKYGDSDDPPWDIKWFDSDDVVEVRTEYTPPVRSSYGGRKIHEGSIKHFNSIMWVTYGSSYNTGDGSETLIVSGMDANGERIEETLVFSKQDNQYRMQNVGEVVNGRVRLDAEFLDEFDDGTIQLRIFSPVFCGMSEVIIANKGQAVDKYDGTYIIDYRCVMKYLSHSDILFYIINLNHKKENSSEQRIQTNNVYIPR